MIINNIIEAKSALDQISGNKNLPSKVAYKIYILLSELQPSLKFFENKRRELFGKYGKEEGENIIIPVENRDLFYKEFNELCQVETEKEIKKVDISLDIDLGISPSDFALLEPFFNFIE